MDKVERLERRIQDLENIIGMMVKSDRYTFSKDLEFDNGRNIVLSGDVGTTFGTKTTQKIGFYGQTPVVQANFIAAPTGGSTVDTECRDQLFEVLVALKNLGLTAQP